MATITFDTLKFAATLKAAGIPADQADAQARAMAEVFTSTDVVTKDDLKNALLELKVDMIKWMVGLLLAQTALLAGIIFALLSRLPH
jgi:hypothetical protein